MSRLNSKLSIGVACSLAVILACSKARAGSQTASDSGSAQDGETTASSADSTLDCAKVFAPGDAAGLLTAAAKVTTYTYRSGSCTLETENAGSVRIYTGTDYTSELTWNDVTKSVHRSKYVALPGVGDEAYRNISDGSEVFARKGALYCTVELFNVKNPATPHGEELSRKLGALCNKVFAVK
jgi:hypothetical protein